AVCLGSLTNRLRRQQVPQALQRVAGSPLDRSRRLAEHLGHFPVAKPLEVVEHQERTIRLFEAVERRDQVSGLVVRGRGFERTRPPRDAVPSALLTQQYHL